MDFKSIDVICVSLQVVNLVRLCFVVILKSCRSLIYEFPGRALRISRLLW